MLGLTFLSIGLVYFCSFLSFCGGVETAQKPNVLFIVIDDLRPALGCFDDRILTPNIDQLAEKSVKFTQAYVQQAVCAPSRISFLTSRRPDTTKLYNFCYYWRTFAGNYTTLPQHFKQNGYFTASVGKIFHPGKASGKNDDYPYSWSVPAYHPPTQLNKTSKVCENPDGTLHENLLCPVDVAKMPEKSLPDIQSTNHAIGILKNISSNTIKEPFFLAVGYHKPHVPFKYPKDFKKLYPLSSVWMPSNNFFPPGLPTVAWVPYDDMRKREDVASWNASYPFGPIPLNYQRMVRQNYFASTTYIDYEVGRLLSALDEAGLADNTIITFKGDHGWQLGEHEDWAKFSLFNEATRVPLFFHIPGVTTKKQKKQGETFQFINTLKDTKLKEKHLKRLNDLTAPKKSSISADLTTDAFVELVDLFPTLAELAGLQVPPTCPSKPFKTMLCTEGTSLVPLINQTVYGKKDSKIIQWKNATFSQYPRPSDYPCSLTDLSPYENITIMGYSMQTTKYRYTEWIGFDTNDFSKDWNKVHARELYMMDSDKQENYNVANKESNKDLIIELSGQLKDGWRNSLPILKND
ncbi:iduronate 2-sulfatase-like [Antedon mediterranea]|uniref:iduronate 2-sulfatase-like n=1 Tax=Antedon mediterranea TaxID=105859 RepID=UPI003AF4C73C